MSRYTVNGVLSADVANAGTFTVNYPTGTNKGTFQGAVDHDMVVGGNPVLRHLDQFLVAPGTSSITITNRSGSTWPAGSTFVIGLEIPGDRDLVDEKGRAVKRSNCLKVCQISLGAPIAAAANSIATSQAIASATNATLNGTLVSGGYATLDVARNVTVTSSNAGDTTQTATVYGVDEYDVSVVETISFNGAATIQGKKAFKRVTRVAISAALAGNLTVGHGDVLGLPVFLEDADYILKEFEDNTVPTAGTTVAAVTSKATATTGDVRGTYDPNSACDGAKVFRLWIALSDPVYRGASQYTA